MFVCFLDASKAFDSVDYLVLFRKLVDRKFPAYIMRLGSRPTMELVWSPLCQNTVVWGSV